MKYLLDTNIIIFLMKNRPPAIAERVNRIGQDSQIGMSFFTYAELLKGAERSTAKNQVLRDLKRLIRQVPVQFAANERLCAFYARQFTKLGGARTPISANDLWVACHALAEEAVLVTNNIREFQRVSGLKLEDWSRS